jgi:hypothetical protein
MDNYESATTALKIPFFPLELRFPARDVLKAVMIGRSCLPSSFSIYFLYLFSQPLY